MYHVTFQHQLQNYQRHDEGLVDPSSQAKRVQHPMGNLLYLPLQASS